MKRKVQIKIRFNFVDTVYALANVCLGTTDLLWEKTSKAIRNGVRIILLPLRSREVNLRGNISRRPLFVWSNNAIIWAITIFKFDFQCYLTGNPISSS